MSLCSTFSLFCYFIFKKWDKKGLVYSQCQFAILSSIRDLEEMLLFPGIMRDIDPVSF